MHLQPSPNIQVQISPNLKNIFMGVFHSVGDRACYEVASLGSMNEVTVESGACDGRCDKPILLPGGGHNLQ